jgi:hypothetical protein
MTVTNHAIKRFRERTGSKKSDDKIRTRLLTILSNAKEVRLKKKFRVAALLNHHLRDARYFQLGGFVLVVEGDCLSTIHRGEANRWESIN